MRVTVELRGVFFDVHGKFYRASIETSGMNEFDIKSITLMDPKQDLLNFFCDEEVEQIAEMAAECADVYLASMKEIEKEESL